MNITIEDLGPCKKLLRAEADAAALATHFETVAKDYARQAALPGFRPGKAPVAQVARRFDKEITEEVKQKVIRAAFDKAVADHKLKVAANYGLEVVGDFARGTGLSFVLTLETIPDFTLPAYKGLAAKRETGDITDKQVDDAVEALRGRQAKYENATRALQTGDFAVIDYEGRVEGKPLTDFAPTARGLTEKKNYWLHIQPGEFIPGFGEQLVGAQPGETRTVQVDFPADFVSPQLAGKHAEYRVTLNEVKVEVLPAVDDAFAKSFGTESMEKLREGIRTDLTAEQNSRRKQAVRSQLVEALLAQVQCELPETIVNQVTRNVVYDIVSENQRRGIPKEAIDKDKDAIYENASVAAKSRVKASYIFGRIAEAEGLRPTREEINMRIIGMAQRYQMTPEKFVKELEKNDGFEEIINQLTAEKVIEFLAEHAKVEDVAAAA